MKLTAMALASTFALSGTCGFAHTVPHGSDVRTHTTYGNAAPPVVLQPNYGNSNGNFGGYGPPRPGDRRVGTASPRPRGLAPASSRARFVDRASSSPAGW